MVMLVGMEGSVGDVVVVVSCVLSVLGVWLISRVSWFSEVVMLVVRLDSVFCVVVVCCRCCLILLVLVMFWVWCWCMRVRVCVLLVVVCCSSVCCVCWVCRLV